MRNIQRICEKASNHGAQVYEVMLRPASFDATPYEIREAATKLHAIGRIMTKLSDDLWLEAERVEKEIEKEQEEYAVN